MFLLEPQITGFVFYIRTEMDHSRFMFYTVYFQTVRTF